LSNGLPSLSLANRKKDMEDESMSDGDDYHSDMDTTEVDRDTHNQGNNNTEYILYRSYILI